MLRFIASFFGGIFSMLTLGAFFGALTIGGVFHFYGKDLPNHEQLAQYTPPTISRIYSGEGRMIDEFARERRIFVSSDGIPDLVKQAFISAEDKTFYSHSGYDVLGMMSAARDALKGNRLRGASTITQQVMKNFLLSSDRSAERKIKELILAARVETALSKDRILELYLNEIFLGQNSFGVAAAAQTYFNKTLSELTVSEAAYLASLPKSPSKRHPVRNYDQAIFWRNNTLRLMHQNGYIDTDTYQSAKAEELLTVQSGDIEPFKASLPPRDYFTDEIRRQLSSTFGEEEFFGGGLTIRATVDPELQELAAIALREGLEKYDRSQGLWRGTGETIPTELLDSEEDWRAALAEVEVARDVPGWHPAVVLSVGETHARIGIEGIQDDEDGHFIPPNDVTWARRVNEDGSRGRKARVAGDLLKVGEVVHIRAMTKDSDGSFIRWTLRQVPEVQGGFMAMDVQTGRVLAMQGGFSYQDSELNRATQAMRQPGSSFKPFVYAAAMDSGFTPASIIVDAPIEIDTPEGVWRPKNASNRYYGPTPIRTGIEQSRNLMTIRLAQEVSMYTVAGYAERFGVYDSLQPFLANSLGAQETTLFRIVTAYAMLANGGERIVPSLVDRVQDRWGRTIYRHDQRSCTDCISPTLVSGSAPEITSDRERVIDAITAYQITSMMEGVVKRGSGKGVNLPVPVAGKTGTTNDAKDVWFVGYSSNIAAGCYMGHDQPRSLGRGAYGGTLCVPIFQAFMEQAVKKYGGTRFRVPPGGYFMNIDRHSGMRLPEGASGPNVIAEYFRNGDDPAFGIYFDGGFAMGSNLPLFGAGESDTGATVTTSSGNSVTIAPRASFGTVTSGGLY